MAALYAFIGFFFLTLSPTQAEMPYSGIYARPPVVRGTMGRISRRETVREAPSIPMQQTDATGVSIQARPPAGASYGQVAAGQTATSVGGRASFPSKRQRSNSKTREDAVAERLLDQMNQGRISPDTETPEWINIGSELLSSFMLGR